jgi:hypothetical protein
MIHRNHSLIIVYNPVDLKIILKRSPNTVQFSRQSKIIEPMPTLLLPKIRSNALPELKER